MSLNKTEMFELAEIVASAVVKALEERSVFGSAATKSDKTAYQRTEQLLYNYNRFKKKVAECAAEIEDIKKFGVPKKSKSITSFGGASGTVGGIVLPEESVECAVQRIESSVQDTVQAIALVDKCMTALKYDPYFAVLEMYYFEGRTLEDIALDFKCTQPNITYHRKRLVKELSIELFPDKVVRECLQ